MKIKHGSKRIVRRFLWLPKTLRVQYSPGRWDESSKYGEYIEAVWGKETRWLEWAWIEQVRGEFWYNIRFLTKDKIEEEIK